MAEPISSSFTKLAEIIKLSLVVGSKYPSKATSSKLHYNQLHKDFDTFFQIRY